MINAISAQRRPVLNKSELALLLGSVRVLQTEKRAKKRAQRRGEQNPSNADYIEAARHYKIRTPKESTYFCRRLFRQIYLRTFNDLGLVAPKSVEELTTAFSQLQNKCFRLAKAGQFISLKQAVLSPFYGFRKHSPYMNRHRTEVCRQHARQRDLLRRELLPVIISLTPDGLENLLSERSHELFWLGEEERQIQSKATYPVTPSNPSQNTIPVGL